MSDDRFLNMIRQFIGQLIERLYQGRSTYEAERRMLQRQLDAADKLDDSQSKAHLQMGLAILNSWYGYFDEAITQYKEADRAFKANELYGSMVVVRCNMAETYRHAGKFDDALDALISALEIADNHQISNRHIGLIYANFGAIWLTRQNYEQAEINLVLAIELLTEESWQNIRELAECYRNLGEIHLNRGEFQTAWGHVEHAYRLASGKQTHMNLVEVYLTMAHIAARHPNTPETHDVYYQKARDLLVEQGETAVVARVLLSEAQYQYTHGNSSEAARLAKEAYDLFTKMDIIGDAEIAKSLIARA